MTSSSTGPIIFRRVTCRTTFACSRANRTSMVRSFASRDRPACSRRTWTGRAIAVCFQNHRRRELHRAALKPGVLGVLPGIIGLIQATEALKLIVGAGETLAGRLLHFDALKMKFREFKLRRDPECAVCGERPTIVAPIDYEQFCDGHIAGDALVSSDMIPSIAVQDLKRRMDAQESLTLIDVREPWEYEAAQIKGSKLIPLGELEARLGEIPREGTIVLHCHSGVRSEQGANVLKQAGFVEVYNLEGGIEAWSRDIDPTVPRY